MDQWRYDEDQARIHRTHLEPRKGRVHVWALHPRNRLKDRDTEHRKEQRNEQSDD